MHSLGVRKGEIGLAGYRILSRINVDDTGCKRSVTVYAAYGNILVAKVYAAYL